MTEIIAQIEMRIDDDEPLRCAPLVADKKRCSHIRCNSHGEACDLFSQHGQDLHKDPSGRSLRHPQCLRAQIDLKIPNDPYSPQSDWRNKFERKIYTKQLSDVEIEVRLDYTVKKGACRHFFYAWTAQRQRADGTWAKRHNAHCLPRVMQAKSDAIAAATELWQEAVTKKSTQDKKTV